MSFSNIDQQNPILGPNVPLPLASTAIDNKYAALGGAKSFLGKPTTAEMPTRDGKGRYRHFEGGSIFCKSGTNKAYEVHGLIRQKYAAMSWELGLGYPVTDETDTPDKTGRCSAFEGGSIYWLSGANEAHEVHGLIYQKYTALGGVTSPLKYPLTDETDTPDKRQTY